MAEVNLVISLWAQVVPEGSSVPVLLARILAGRTRSLIRVMEWVFVRLLLDALKISIIKERWAIHAEITQRSVKSRPAVANARVNQLSRVASAKRIHRIFLPGADRTRLWLIDGSVCGDGRHDHEMGYSRRVRQGDRYDRCLV